MRTAFHPDRIFTAESDELSEGYVVVEDGRIQAIRSDPPGDVSQCVRLPGATMLPGLINAHSHVSIIPSRGDQIGQLRLPIDEQLAASRSNMLCELLSGATTLRVMGQELGVDFALREEIQSGAIPGPDLLCAGRPIAKSGHHGHALTSVSSAAEIEELALDNIRQGARLLKVFATGGVSSSGTLESDCPFSLDELRLVCRIAHENGLPVAAHALVGEGVGRAIEAGVDTIEHASLVDQSLIDSLAARRSSVVGTFSIVFHPAGLESESQANPEVGAKLERVRPRIGECWRKIVDSGLPIALGTDSVHGAMAFEIARLVEFGASEAQALQSATRIGAEVCRLKDRGTIQPGLRADLIAVLGNPLEDIRSVANPILVVQEGRTVHRA